MTILQTPVEHLEWLVNSRSELQTLALKILKEIRSRRSRPDWNSEMQSISHLMVAAAFSLWRAVFYTRVALDETSMADHADTFLETVIQDNAIAYTQERNSREWTFGYYLNNAAMRMGVIAEKRTLFREILQNNKILTEDLKWREVAGQEDAKVIWKIAYDALNLAVENAAVVLSASDITGSITHAIPNPVC